MAIIGDALRQAFMPKPEYESLKEEDRVWGKLQRPLLVAFVALVCVVVMVCVVITLKMVFPSDPARRPFCGDRGIQPLPINVKGGDSDPYPHAFYLTDQETVDYFWMVCFVPTMITFLLTVVYLISGIAVAYSSPMRHVCLKVVENSYCASKRGGVRCLSILNAIFAIVFGLLALFLGSSLLTLGNNCSKPLFWCYEFASWGLVILYGGTAFFLRRKAADNGDSSQNHGLEMFVANPFEVTPGVERRVSEGFKAWMGSSYLSSDDDEDEPDHEASPLTRTPEERQGSIALHSCKPQGESNETLCLR
ncbi:hypothetical protein G4B88_027890, partial [Cannabis sativa]